MAKTTRALDDLILDGIKAAIDAVRVADVALDATLNFELTRDRSRPWDELTIPRVDVTLESDTPDRDAYTARYKILCLAPNSPADSLGALPVLKEQVRRALTALVNYDFGQAVGKIGKRSRPTWTRVNFDDTEYDRDILAGTWTMEITYAYDADDLTLPALTDISATVGAQSAHYTP